MRYPELALALALLLWVGGPAGVAGARDTSPSSDAALIAASGIPATQVAFAVYPMETDEPVLAHHPDRLLMPASAVKLSASLAALHVLGEDHRFETRLHATGRVVDGVLNGSLILEGRGDPMLLSEDLTGFVQRLAALGIRRVAGAFHYDDGFITPTPALQPRHELDVGYNPGVAGLALNFNRVRLEWERGRPRDTLAEARALAVTDRMSHAVDFLELGTIPRPQPRFPTFVYERTEEGGRWLLTPQVGARGEFWVPVKQPGLYAASVLRVMAATQGIALPRPTRGQAPEGARTIHTSRSIPLARIGHKMLHFSNNLVAEMLGAATARELTGEPQTLASAGNVVTRWWRTRLPDVRWDGMVLENHSGLSSTTRMSPAQLAAMLRFAAGHRYEGRGYERYLRRFTLARPQEQLTRRAWVRGKTGTVDYARALAGYMRSNAGRRYVFAVIISNGEQLAAEAGRERAPTRAERRSARRWNRDARELLRDLVFRWLREL